MSKPKITIHVETPDAFIKGTAGEVIDFHIRGKASVLVPAFMGALDQVAKFLASGAPVPSPGCTHVQAYGHEGYVGPMHARKASPAEARAINKLLKTVHANAEKANTAGKVPQPLSTTQSKSFRAALDKAAERVQRSAKVLTGNKPARKAKGKVKVEDLRVAAKAAPVVKAGAIHMTAFTAAKIKEGHSRGLDLLETLGEKLRADSKSAKAATEVNPAAIAKSPVTGKPLQFSKKAFVKSNKFVPIKARK